MELGNLELPVCDTYEPFLYSPPKDKMMVKELSCTLERTTQFWEQEEGEKVFQAGFSWSV